MAEHHHLNPLVSFIRSYVTDTKQFLARLTEIGAYQNGAYLCTVDLVGIYLCIPHSKGLSAIREELGRRLDRLVTTDTVVNLAFL